jgi:predicted transcriptional regulator of viral defense system
MPTLLERAKDKIQSQIQYQKGKIHTEASLLGFLSEHTKEWNLTKRVPTRVLIDFLVKHVGLKVVDLNAEKYGRTVRYSWGDYSPFLMALSLRSRGYISHGTAVFLQGLSGQVSKTIYVNQEQSEKPRGSGLSQERLNLAFSRLQRTSAYVYTFGAHQAVILSGKQTGALGVVRIEGPHREELPVTGLPRTLIDIVVRPAYAGGLRQVLEAYRLASRGVGGAELVRMLGKLDYVYPYHQAIGFLMERAGFPAREWGKLLRLGTRYDFYLLHGMQNPGYDKKWRIFIPEDL